MTPFDHTPFARLTETVGGALEVMRPDLSVEVFNRLSFRLGVAVGAAEGEAHDEHVAREAERERLDAHARDIGNWPA